jgi:hypothetical protein
MEPTSLRFARLARRLGEAAQAQGLRAPTFRSPPRVPGVTRTIRRGGGGGRGGSGGGGGGGGGGASTATVSVVLRGRPWAAVTSDMIEGTLVANDLTGVAADRTRAALWSALADMAERAA